MSRTVRITTFLLLGVAAAQQVPIVNAGFESGVIGRLPPGWTATADPLT